MSRKIAPLIPLLPLALGVSLSTAALAKTVAKKSVQSGSSVKVFCEAFESAETEAQRAACPNDAKLKEKTERAVQQCIELLNSGISQKRQTFSADAAKGCLAAEKAYAADPARSRYLHDAVRGACAFVVNGTVEEGKDCESALDCRDGLTCLGDKGAPPGKCKPRLPPGSACDDELLGGSRFYAAATAARAACGASLHCGAKGAELVCVANASAGQTCEGEASACGPGLRCNAGRCIDETLARAQQACATSADCAVGLQCEENRCVEAKPADCGTAPKTPKTPKAKAGKDAKKAKSTD